MFETVSLFERSISSFFGAPYAVAVDCCTHGIELCLRYLNVKTALVPMQTYLSIPMTCEKLQIQWNWKDDHWEEYYKLDGSNIYDAATLWRPNSYLPETFMCISFQYKKHLSLGRGGVILCPNKDDYDTLVRLSYDGRDRGTPWASQNISSIGYHYYMTPETATLGLEKFDAAVKSIPKKWSFRDYPNLAESYSCFSS